MRATHASMLRIVAIHAVSRLAAQTPCRHEFTQQRTRAIFRVAEILQEHIHHRQAHVQPDQIRERERPDRMIRAETHARVDLLRRGDE